MTKILRNWKACLILSQILGIPLAALTLLLLSAFGFTGCSTAPVPKWEGKLWAGDSAQASVRRAQENQEIKASDPLFDNYLAMSYQDFRSFYATYVLGCKEWKPGVSMMPADEALARFSVAMKDLENQALDDLKKKIKK